MNKYPQRIWKVYSSTAGIFVKEYGARETDKLFKVTGTGVGPEEHVRKANLDKVLLSYGDCYMWVMEEDDLQRAVDQVRQHAMAELDRKIGRLEEKRAAVGGRPRVARYNPGSFDDLEPTDDMF